MSETYQAIITGNTIRWLVPPPKEIETGKEISVEITVKTSDKKNLARGIAMYNSLKNLSKLKGVISSVENPAEWQREMRKDRTLDR
ncbi:MAG: hypothetical protein A2315_16495 [Ignavibacteria bacterium RIFOXYB2_FULL_35_12]|nr:MAG: hypothetical protein A2058_11990 [Ignavibacteria bacterium GWA2_36_19]OGU49360.1 MAG: hypothetical protein A2006_12035 [Ignavibacteria bacterium GWC2_35_8]OGU61290.1 MAG: hypothetical protein A2X60_13410 [Ignavibacteria bacterium GWF2_35_20]OGU81068.1 MAG: hypothetical protein A2W11_03870 [Ignavibacteria bacterium RBG_16_35_7]OGU81472.1 MAG: hypothetical protein A2254_03280 [Ignavibacteria bacterium RIFOXYA2_FULL_35_9]OGU84126.1 MAG: hypothetical protein A3K31_11015 [Ignavibacteria bac